MKKFLPYLILSFILSIPGNIQAQSIETDILTFTLPEETGPATIDAINHTIDINVVDGTVLICESHF